MKVLVNKANIKNEKQYKLICPHCNSELEYEKNDLYWNFNGNKCGMSVDCPCCGEIIVVDECSPIEYPKAFFHMGQNDKGAKISDAEIQEWIRQGINKLESCKGKDDEWVWYCGTGDTMVTIYRYDGDRDYWVYVYKNYWENSIGFDEVNKFIK